MRKVICSILVCVLLSGCNTGVAFSILGDIVKLRVERDVAGEGHIEDVLKE